MIQHIRLDVAGQGQSTSSVQRIKEFAFLRMKGFALGHKILTLRRIDPARSRLTRSWYVFWFYFGSKNNGYRYKMSEIGNKDIRLYGYSYFMFKVPRAFRSGFLPDVIDIF